MRQDLPFDYAHWQSLCVSAFQSLNLQRQLHPSQLGHIVKLSVEVAAAMRAEHVTQFGSGLSLVSSTWWGGCGGVDDAAAAAASAAAVGGTCNHKWLTWQLLCISFAAATCPL